MRAALAVAVAALLGACGSGADCCTRTYVLPATGSYVGTFQTSEGGVKATLTLLEGGLARLSYWSHGHLVEVEFTVGHTRTMLSP